MSIKRITISVPVEVAGRIKKAAGDKPISTWVTDVIEEHLDDAELERHWEDFYRDVAPKPVDRRHAETTFKRLTKRKRQRGAA
jgi:hypothetical protein